MTFTRAGMKSFDLRVPKSSSEYLCKYSKMFFDNLKHELVVFKWIIRNYQKNGILEESAKVHFHCKKCGTLLKTFNRELCGSSKRNSPFEVNRKRILNLNNFIIRVEGWLRELGPLFIEFGCVCVYAFSSCATFESAIIWTNNSHFLGIIVAPSLVHPTAISVAPLFPVLIENPNDEVDVSTAVCQICLWTARRKHV